MLASGVKRNYTSKYLIQTGDDGEGKIRLFCEPKGIIVDTMLPLLLLNYLALAVVSLMLSYFDFGGSC